MMLYYKQAPVYYLFIIIIILNHCLVSSYVHYHDCPSVMTGSFCGEYIQYTQEQKI